MLNTTYYSVAVGHRRVSMLLALCAAMLLLDSWILSAGAAVDRCPAGWVNWSNYCYYFSSYAKSFGDSEVACNRMLSHLVSIHSREENAFVTKAAADYDHWIGIDRKTDRDGALSFKREDWHWTDKTSFDFFYWPENEPSSNAPCALIVKKSDFWDERACREFHRFICKKDATLPTSTAATINARKSSTTATAITKTGRQATTNSAKLTSTTFPPITTTTRASTITTLTTTHVTAPTVSGLTSPEQPRVDGTATYNNSSSTSDLSGMSPTTPRQAGHADTGRGKSGLGLYIGVAAGCVVLLLAAVVAGVIMYRRKKSKTDDPDGMFKRYVAPDADFVYTRNETPDRVEVSAADNVRRRPGNRSRTPYVSIHVEDFTDNSVNSGGQSFDATPSVAILNAGQQRPPASNTDQDVADLYVVPMKKKKRSEEAPTPETSPGDNTEIEHVENDLYQSAGYDNVQILDGEVIVVENDLYDQASVVL